MASLKENRKYFCGHCKMNLSKTTFFSHKKIYFDKHNNCWKSKATQVTKETDDDFIFDGSESDGKFMLLATVIANLIEL